MSNARKTERLVRKCFCKGCIESDGYIHRCDPFCVVKQTHRIVCAARVFVKAEQAEKSNIPSFTFKTYSLKDMKRIGKFAHANQLKMIREGEDFPGKNLVVEQLNRNNKKKGKGR